jgi:predicted dehydrogenase
MPTELPADRPVRWGVLGAGGIAAVVGSDIRASPQSEVAAVGARDLDRASRLAADLGASRAYGSYQELVADPDLDVIYVATTHAQHHEHALLALRAGKPVLVEKAFTLNAREAREVLDEAVRQDLFCMEAMWMNCNPLIRQAREIATSGQLGDILSVTVDHSQDIPYSRAPRLYDMDAGGGALLDLGVYSATFAWDFLGAPDSVSSTGMLYETGADITVAMQWNYADNRFAHVSATSQADTPCVGFVVGTRGWLRLSSPFYQPDTLVVHLGDDEQTFSSQLPGYGYGPEVAEVETCLRNGAQQSELVPWADTLAIMALMDGVRADLGVRYQADDPQG